MFATNTSIVLDGKLKAIDGQDRCCHLLGCDIMLDIDGKAWMLEVNTNPSILCETAVDWDIKEPLAESLLHWLYSRSVPMAQYLTKFNAEIEQRAKAFNNQVKAQCEKSGIELTIPLLAGGCCLNRPKPSPNPGFVAGSKPAIPAYQQAVVSDMNVVGSGDHKPLYFVDLESEITECQVCRKVIGE